MLLLTNVPTGTAVLQSINSVIIGSCLSRRPLAVSKNVPRRKTRACHAYLTKTGAPIAQISTPPPPSSTCKWRVQTSSGASKLYRSALRLLYPVEICGMHRYARPFAGALAKCQGKRSKLHRGYSPRPHHGEGITFRPAYAPKYGFRWCALDFSVPETDSTSSAQRTVDAHSVHATLCLVTLFCILCPFSCYVAT